MTADATTFVHTMAAKSVAFENGMFPDHIVSGVGSYFDD